MQPTTVSSAAAATPPAVRPTVFGVLFGVSFVHLLNDTIQSVVPAMFPIVKESLALSYTELGLIAFALNATASVLQPAIGLYSDARPQPYILPLGMASTLLGVLGLAFCTDFWMIMLSVIFIGVGSSIFHPESSRVAYLAAGARRGMAQSIFQVGGNGGQALAPIMDRTHLRTARSIRRRLVHDRRGDHLGRGLAASVRRRWVCSPTGPALPS